MNNIVQRGSTSPLTTFVDEARKAQAKAAASGERRLIFAIEATASRQPAWDLACRLQGELFQAAEAVGRISVQLCYFRGEAEFHASPVWTSRAEILTRLMSEVSFKSGHTQIGKVLAHVRREATRGGVAACIYVGDAVEESGSVLVRLAEETGVPVFCFHEDPDDNHSAVKVFQEIARVSHGAYLPFNRNSAAELAGLLAAIGTYAAGGRTALEKSGTAAARLLLRHVQ